MDLRQLRTFQTVARLGSFTRAAATLDYAQSSVTAQIQTLEERLGVQLFDRLGKKIVLTDAGENLLAYANQLLKLAEEAEYAVTQGDTPAGRLVIGTQETLSAYRLPPLLVRFRQQFEQVKLSFHPTHWTQTLQLVRDGVVDVAVMLARSYPPTKNLCIETLMEEPLLLVAAPSYPIANQPLTAERLQNEVLLLTETGCSYRTLFEEALSREGITLRETMTFHSVEAIKQCVMATIGIGFLPKVAVRDELASGQLVALEWRQPNLKIPIQLVWHERKVLSPALRAFLSLSRELLV